MQFQNSLIEFEGVRKGRDASAVDAGSAFSVKSVQRLMLSMATQGCKVGVSTPLERCSTRRLRGILALVKYDGDLRI